MTWKAKAYLESLGETERTQFLTTHYPMGYHPVTKDVFYTPLMYRYMGMYVLGGKEWVKAAF